MHYRNGREAKQGDKVLSLTSGHTGLIHSLSAQSQTCNGRIALVTPSDPYVTLSECLHLDDVAEAFPGPPK